MNILRSLLIGSTLSLAISVAPPPVSAQVDIDLFNACFDEALALTRVLFPDTSLAASFGQDQRQAALDGGLRESLVLWCIEDPAGDTVRQNMASLIAEARASVAAAPTSVPTPAPAPATPTRQPAPTPLPTAVPDTRQLQACIVEAHALYLSYLRYAQILVYPGPFDPAGYCHADPSGATMRQAMALLFALAGAPPDLVQSILRGGARLP